MVNVGAEEAENFWNKVLILCGGGYIIISINNMNLHLGGCTRNNRRGVPCGLYSIKSDKK